MDPQSDLKSFAHSFFSNLGCAVTQVPQGFSISNVPADFEAAYGKKGPYVVTFDQQASGELVARGSFLLKTMTSYLDQRGQTALVKLVFDQDYLGAFKRSFTFKKCELVSLTKSASFRPLYLFSFSTTLQYLNEKEQVMNTLALHEGQVVPFTLDQYTYVAGDAREISLSGAKEAYAHAKDSLKGCISSRLNEVSLVLEQKLAQETARIRDHYAHQLAERETTLIKIKEQLATLEKASPLTAAMAQRRDRLIENLRILESPDFENKIVEERDFFVRDEEFKHALSVSNKLVSTTIVYYPVFTFNLHLKNADVARVFSIIYNPFKNMFESPVTCEQCHTDIREIILCGSSHIICGNCFDSCRSCERGMCGLCMKKTCTQCARKLCKRCVARCGFCWKDVCKTHIRINYATEGEGCTGCLRACSRCGAFADNKHRIRDLDGSEICLKCNNLSRIKLR